MDDKIEINDIDDLAVCIKEYALAQDDTLTSDALHLKYSLLKAAAPLLEAQHRKTWALAMGVIKDYLENERLGAGAYGFEEEAERLGKMWDDFATLPCPPIEADSIAELKTNEKPHG